MHVYSPVKPEVPVMALEAGDHLVLGKMQGWHVEQVAHHDLEEGLTGLLVVVHCVEGDLHVWEGAHCEGVVVHCVGEDVVDVVEDHYVEGHYVEGHCVEGEGLNWEVEGHLVVGVEP